MSLKGRGQGVDLGTSTLSFMRSIICSLFGRDFPYDPLNLFPFFVFLSPRPHNIGAATPEETEGVSADAPLINHLAATVHRCIALAAPLAILFFFVICCSSFGSCVLSTTHWIVYMSQAHSLKIYSIFLHLLSIPPIFWGLLMITLTISFH
jgi:hypothetical protein